MKIKIIAMNMNMCIIATTLQSKSEKWGTIYVYIVTVVVIVFGNMYEIKVPCSQSLSSVPQGRGELSFGRILVAALILPCNIIILN